MNKRGKRLATFVVLGVTGAAMIGAGPVETGRGVKVATVRFNGGKGRPSAPVYSGDVGIDLGATPLPSGGVVFRAAAFDLISIALDGPSTFTGKTVAMNADGVTITERSEGWFIFSKKVEERKHHDVSQPHPVRLRVGSEVRVRALVEYDGLAGSREVLEVPRSGVETFRMARPGTVTLLPLGVDGNAVAWTDRAGLTPHEHAEYERWLQQVRARGYREVHPRRSTVQRGDLDRLKVRLSLTRR